VCSTPFGLSGRTGCVEDEQRIFGIHLRRRTIGFDAGHSLMIPDVTLGEPGDLAGRAAHDNHRFDLDAAALGDLDGLVGIGLQRDRLAAAQAFIGGDDDGGFAVNDTAGQRVGRKTAENDRVHRADTGTGEHRIGRFRDHRHVDGDAITLVDAVCLQHIGEAADMLVQFAIGDLLVVIGIVAFPDDRHLIAAFFQVPVDAIVGDVGDAILEPLDRNIALERGVLDLVKGLNQSIRLPCSPQKASGSVTLCLYHA
jgi:hypothetical protein